jgi:hypothetical protein
MLSHNCGASSDKWGSDLSIVTVSNFKYLPGVYALFNSALINGFEGRFILAVSEEMDTALIAQHPKLSLLKYHSFPGKYNPNVDRLKALQSLPIGKYLYLDADIVIERPCGYFWEPIEAGLVVSTEPESKYDAYDIIIYHQCKILGLPTDDLPVFSYVNGGLLGFLIPRDKSFIDEWVEFSRIYLEGIETVFFHPYFNFLDQDILNLLVRKNIREGKAVFSISPKKIELSNFSKVFRNRPFPYTKQQKNQPADQIKYLIHGASLRRPWLQQIQGGSPKKRLQNLLENYGVGAWYRKPFPYERAWAYYACSEEMPIPVSAWAERHSFTAYKHWLWRKAYGL